MPKNHMRNKGRGYLFLLAHVNYRGDDCLKWPLSCDSHGYAQVGVSNKLRKAYRVMCELAHGDPPTPTHHAAHSCGKGHLGCVNPRHLSWKTPRENVLDAVRHGRYGWGPGWKGKLSHEKASEIRALSERMTNSELGALYGVHAETIAKIRRGETWRKKAA